MRFTISAHEGVLVGHISVEGRLTGVISSNGNLVGTIHSDGNLYGTLSVPEDYVDYIGSYDVIPKVTEQIVNTHDRHMTDDLTVKAIPYAEVTNQANGMTATIG